MKSAIAAIASGVIAFVASGFLVAFYVIEAPQILRTGTGPMTLGTINDVLIILQFLLLAWVVVVFGRHLRGSYTLRLAMTGIGLLGIGLVVLAQGLLVARVWKIDTNSLVVTPGIGLTGTWLLLANWKAVASGRIGRRLGWLGIVSGAFCLIRGASFFLFNGPSAASSPHDGFTINIPLIVGSAIGLLGFAFGLPMWSIWLGLRWPASNTN